MESKRVFSRFLVFAVALGVLLSAAGQRLATEDELFNRGLQNFRQKSFRPAVEAFQELLKRFPKSPRARQVEFLIAESYRLGRRFGRTSTYPLAEKAYKAMIEAPAEDLWKARGQAGLARLYLAWGYWSRRSQIDDLFKKASQGFAAKVNAGSPKELRRELGEILADRIEAGARLWGYTPNWQEVVAQQAKTIAAGGEVSDYSKRRAAWWASMGKLLAQLDALQAGKDLEARARWALGQRGAVEYLKEIDEKYADTEWWDDAVFRMGQYLEGQGKFVDALAWYEKLTKRLTERQSRYVRSARQRAAEIRKPRLGVSANYAALPGTRPTISYSWRNQKQAVFKVFRTEPFGHPRHTSLLEMARAGRGQPVLSWQTPLENKGEHKHYGAQKELDLSEPGVYLVTADGGGVHADCVVIITRLAVVTKSSRDQAMVFVADALTGEPVSGADVQLAWHWWENRSRRWAEKAGRTDDAGFFRTPHPSGRSGNWYILARKGTSYAFSRSYRGWWSPMSPGLTFYGYTDRPAYRPGEEVHFKFIVRNYDGNTFQNVVGRKFRVRINEPRGGKLYEKVLATNEFGTLADSVKLANEPPLGQYTIYIRQPDNRGRSGYARFRVEEYKLPEFKVEISTDKPTYRVGDTLRVKIKADYYFGGPVPEADVEVLVRQRPYWHYYIPPREYPWYYYDIYRRRWGWRFWRRGGGTIVKRATLKTDAHGVATLEVPTPRPPQENDYSYSIEARVVDKSRREIRASHTLKVTRDPFYVYVNPRSHVYLPGDRVEVKVVARNANDQPVKTEGMFRVYRAVYNEEKKDYDLTELQADRLATDAEGKAAYAFTPDQPGYLKLEMTALTEKEEKVVGVGWLWVASEKERYLGYRLSGIQVIPDKQTYKKGETAQVLLVSQFPNVHVWLGVEGDRIYDDRLVFMRERSRLVKIPIRDEYSPNVFITANVVRDAMLWRHQREIIVPPEDCFVHLKVNALEDSYRPGETASLELVATDDKGRPLSCEVSLGVVDSSVYYIQPEYAPDIRQFFYGRKRPLAIATNSSFSQIRYKRKAETEMPPGAVEVAEERKQTLLREGAEMNAAQAGGMAFGARRGLAKAAAPPAPGAPAALADAAKGRGADRDMLAHKAQLVQPTLRADFRATAFWNPTIRTDKDGKATVTLKFPDTLTDWTARARAVTAGKAVGTLTFNTKTKKNIIVRLQAPRFFQERDLATVSAIVHNYLPRDKRVRVSLTHSGLQLAGGKPVVEVTVPSGGEKRVDWQVQVVAPGQAKLQVMAQTDEESDAMAKTYEVLPHGVEKFVARSGCVGEPVTSEELKPGESPTGKAVVVETLTLPAERNNLCTVLNIDLSPSIAAAMLDSLEYLARYPYGCVEQTMSRFLPSVIVAKTLRDLGARNERLEAKLPDMVNKGLARLYAAQRSDGGWGWWPGARRTDPWMTAYVCYGLTVARQAGVAVDQSRLQRGIQALRNSLVHLENRPDTMAYALHTLALHKIKEPKWQERIWQRRERLNAYSRALMALAFHHLGDRQRATVMLRNLEDFLEQDKGNRTAHWGKTAGYWRWSDDAVEATSYALKAYLAIEPRNRLVKPIMKWLVNNRRGSRWKSTRDTAFAIYALTDYIRHSRELAPDYKVSVFVNDRKVRELRVTKDNALSLDGRITLGDADLRSGPNTIRIVKEGTGNLYYTAGMFFYTKEERIEGAGHELFVRRTYHKLTLDENNRQKRSPLNYGDEVASGERIEVTLEIEAKNDYEYLVFEDPRPSGCEPVDLRSGYRWGGGLGAYMEVRDEKTAFFVSRISQGTHKITYVVRAEVPGTFNALPTRAYAMYVPDIRGISDEMRLKIGERLTAMLGPVGRFLALSR